MKKWNMIIDVAECTNCQLCALSAMDEYVGNAWPGVAAPMPRHGHQWIDIKQKERGQAPMIDIAYAPTMCNHCDNAPCPAKGGDAGKKRADGIVIIDPDKAKGRKDLVESCPYGHIWWNEELQLPQIWPFDAHLLDQGWQQTRGQQACPTGAIPRPTPSRGSITATSGATAKASSAAAWRRKPTALSTASRARPCA